MPRQWNAKYCPDCHTEKGGKIYLDDYYRRYNEEGKMIYRSCPKCGGIFVANE